MNQVPKTRRILGSYLGKVLTAQVASELELALASAQKYPVAASNNNNYCSETSEYMLHGIKLFQAVLMAETEESHAKILHDVIGAPLGATYVDMGCGIGELSRLFSDCDWDAKFISITNSEVQAAVARELGGSDVILTDFHTTTLADDSVDVVMFNETWGYGNPDVLANEAFRILRPGGRLFIKDWYATESGYSPSWDWCQWTLQDMLDPLLNAGFQAATVQKIPNPNMKRYQKFLESSKLMQELHPEPLRFTATPAMFLGVKP